MEYQLKVKDKLKWIHYVFEERNTEDELVLYVDFRPKRLMVIRSGSMIGNILWDGIMFTKDEDTLYAEGEQFGEVFVHTSIKTTVFIQEDKYSARLVFVKHLDGENIKQVYPIK